MTVAFLIAVERGATTRGRLAERLRPSTVVQRDPVLGAYVAHDGTAPASAIVLDGSGTVLTGRCVVVGELLNNGKGIDWATRVDLRARGIEVLP